MPNLLFIGIVIVLILAAIVGVFFAGFVSASPGEIKVISGPRGQRVIHGKTGWKIPIIERVDRMTAGMISIDTKTAEYVPTNDFINVKVDAVVNVRIGTERPELFEAATRNFLYKSEEQIASEVRDTLEGHLRAIIGQMKLQDIVTDRNKFADTVQNNAKADLEEMGLVIVAFNVQGLVDANGVIENLGIDNIEQIRKEAAIAKAKATAEITEKEAESDLQANEARVRADLAIAEQNNDLIKRQAALKVEQDVELARADAAYSIQEQTQRREIVRETAQADIVRQEQEAIIKEKALQVRKQELEAEIKAKADADLYAEQKQAEADLFKRMKEAEAESYERKQKAQAEKEALIAEAEGIEAKGRAEASAIEAKLKAEAEGLERKAEAMAKMNQAAIFEMYFQALPEVAKALAEPLSNVDSITMYGEGNSSKMVGDLTKMLSQVQQGLGDGLGLDLKQMISTFAGVKAANSQKPTLEENIQVIEE